MDKMSTIDVIGCSFAVILVFSLVMAMIDCYQERNRVEELKKKWTSWRKK